MEFVLGQKVKVNQELFLGRWIAPGEKGRVDGRTSGDGQTKWFVTLDKDNKCYTFVTSELSSLDKGG